MEFRTRISSFFVDISTFFNGHIFGTKSTLALLGLNTFCLHLNVYIVSYLVVNFVKNMLRWKKNGNRILQKSIMYIER